MGDNMDVDSSRHRTRWVWGVAGALVVVIIVVIIVVAVALRPAPKAHDVAASSTPSASVPPPSPTPSASASPTARPSARATSRPTPTSPFPQLAPAAPNDTVKTKGFTVRLAQIEHVHGTASGVGEIAGPALRLTVQITNGTPQPLELNFVVVNAYYGAHLTPANTFERPGGKPFAGTLASGKSASAVLLFAVPTSQQGNVTVSVDYRPGSPAVIFHGSFR